MGLDKGVMTRIHHYSLIQCFSSVPPIHSSPAPIPWQPLLFLLPFHSCHTVAITQYLAFSDWLLLFSNMQLGFLRILSMAG